MPESNAAMMSISELIASGELEQALEHMQVAVFVLPGPKAEQLRREIIQHRGQLAMIMQAARTGQLDTKEHLRERNRIAAVILAVAGDVAALTRPPGSSTLPAWPLNALDPEPVQALPPSTQAVAADIFVSYARADQALIEQLVSELQTAGFCLWYDQYLRGGERYGDIIDRQIDAARVVLVVWSVNAVISDWVRYEAQRGHRGAKLVPLRLPQLPESAVPGPYPAILQILQLGDQPALWRALARLGLQPTPGPA
jgi:TIR domain/Effector-associated domain 11